MTSIHIPFVEDEEETQRDALLIDERMKALASVYQLADSVLSGEKISVKFGPVPNIQAPAWTTGTEIFVNTSTIGLEDFEDIVRLHGLNFHELSHVLYTPRAGTVLAKFCLENDLMPAFNLLEDQRIESLLTTKYPSTAPWLTAAVMRWVTADPKAIDAGYLFVRGRRYLPGQLRGLLRAMFSEPTLLPRIDRVVDAYRLLVFPTQYDDAKALVQEMQEILDKLGQGIPRNPNGHSDCPWHLPDNGRPVPVKEQRALRDRMGKDSPPAKPQPAAPNDQQDGPQDSDPQGDSHDGADGGTSQPESDPPAEEESASATSSGAGDDDRRDQVHNAREQVKDMLDDLLNSDEVVDDVRRTRRSIENSTGESVLTQAVVQDMTPMADYVLMERRLTQTLTLLQEEAEPGWHRREDYGRLNVVRWAIERDVTEAFDRWDEGITDAVDIEAVIMLDVSGSMGGVITEAYNAMWVLKRAFDAVDISTTVITYNGNSETLYNSQQRATPMVRYSFSGGGTNPIRGLNQATRILTASPRTHKLLIVLTDGEWSNGRDDFDLSSDDYVKRLNENGVTTALGYISGVLDERLAMNPEDTVESILERNRHNCSLVSMAQGQNLVPFISDIVTGLIRSRIRSAR